MKTEASVPAMLLFEAYSFRTFNSYLSAVYGVLNAYLAFGGKSLCRKTGIIEAN